MRVTHGSNGRDLPLEESSLAENRIGSFGGGSSPWIVPDADPARQAVAPLRGYVYQLHRSLAAWMALGERDELYLEIAEDYAEVLRDSTRAAEVLTAVQVKDTRGSGSVTLNSNDVLDAIVRLFYLGASNPGREVHLKFLTTSPIGKERERGLVSGRPGIAVWQAQDPADVDELRAALALRFSGNALGDFVRNSDDAELRERLLNKLSFACGEGGWLEVERTSRMTLIGMRSEVNATEDAADRAYDALLARIVSTILESTDRRLDRAAFLSAFAKAASVAVPSQTLENLITQAFGQERASPIAAEDRLRSIARAMLAANAPPLIDRLLSNQDASAQAALSRLAVVERELVEENRLADAKYPMLRTVDALLASPSLHNIIVAPPGSGKTHALRRAVGELLEKGDVIPLYFIAGTASTWRSLQAQILDVDPTIDVVTVLRHPKAVVFVDGWGEFAAENLAERSAAARALHSVRVVASGRRRDVSDATFKLWTLQPLAPSIVETTIADAFGAAHRRDAAFIDLLRLPLLLSLYVLLGGSVVTRGELLRRFHEHVSRGMSERFGDALFGAVAATKLSGDDSYAALVSGLRGRAAKFKIDNPAELLDRLGTLTDRSGRVLPIHDLYLSWLAGMGFLRENHVLDALPDLRTRESFTLAFESKEHADMEMATSSVSSDAVFAATLSVNCETDHRAEVLDRQIEEMLSSPDLAVRVRGAMAGLERRRSRFFRRSLDILSETAGANLFPVDLLSALDPTHLFANRVALAEWLGSPRTGDVLDVVARSGGREWGVWLDEMQRGGRIAPELALSVALACDERIPVWGRPHIEKLLQREPWRLRPAAERAVNLEFARWLAEWYGEIIDRFIDPGTGGWWIINRLLVAAGDDDLFAGLLDRFPAMSPKAKELLGFAVVEKGDPWIARFQMAAFQEADISHHHELAKEVSLEIDDRTAREWISIGRHEMGWRVLVARHGEALVPELLAGLPSSFDGLHYLPTLFGLTFLKSAPESIIDEILSRVSGTMQPMAMEHVLEAIAKVEVVGVPAIVKFCARQPGLLPAYHTLQAVRLYTDWNRKTKLELQIETPTGNVPFREWALIGAYHRGPDSDFLPRGFAFAPDVAIRFVLSGVISDRAYARKILEALDPLERFDRALLNYLLAQPDLTPVALHLFSEVMADLSSDELLQLAALPQIDFANLLWRISRTSNPMHRSFHLYSISKVLSRPINLHHFHYVGSMLRAYSTDDIRELLQKPPLDGRSDNVLWLIRMIEEARRERLIDEAGQLLP